VEEMFQYDPNFASTLHQERVQALKQDYEPLEWKRAPRMKRGRNQLPAWVASLSTRAVWLMAVMIPRRQPDGASPSSAFTPR
jgi:hypothetical protein